MFDPVQSSKEHASDHKRQTEMDETRNDSLDRRSHTTSHDATPHEVAQHAAGQFALTSVTDESGQPVAPSSDNSVDSEELAKERQRLAYVAGKIEERLEKVKQITEARQLDTEEIRRNFWDNVTVNLTNDTERIETFTSIQQEARVLAEQERSEQEARRQYATLLRLADSPYFGRVDFQEDGESTAERIYIGLASLVEPDGETFLIYDWRAPISSLFYDHSPGQASYETPSGTITGTMQLKRQYVIRGGQLQHMFDTDVTIGDSLLQQALSQAASSQMKSIVATIQREQNRIIRDEKHRLLIVQGAAGSGKTSAALQRVAYLLYRYRGSLTADQIVLFSPNPLFSSYISHVLPELGEANMRQSTFQEYLQKRLRKLRLDIEDLYDQTEYLLSQRDGKQTQVRAAAIRYKASPQFFAGMNAYVKYLENAGMKFRSIRFRGRVIVSAEEMSAIFYSEELKKYELSERLEQWRKRVAMLVREAEKLERRKKWVSEAIDLLDDDAYRTAFETMLQLGRSKGDTFDDDRKERAILRKMVVHEQFAPIRKRLNSGLYIDYVAIYRQLFSMADQMREWSGSELPEEWHDFDALIEESLANKRLWYEDATPILYLKEAIEGFPENENDVRHVLVDEAQDYSPFQFAVLRQLFPRARLTVLGDLNQAIYLQTADMDGFSELAKLFAPNDEQSTAVVKLLRSYRSTKPIVELSKQLLPAAADVVPFEREGKPPVFVAVGGGVAAGDVGAAAIGRNAATLGDDAAASGGDVVAVTGDPEVANVASGVGAAEAGEGASEDGSSGIAADTDGAAEAGEGASEEGVSGIAADTDGAAEAGNVIHRADRSGYDHAKHSEAVSLCCEWIGKWQEAGYQSIGLITYSAEEAQTVGAMLEGHLEFNVVTTETTSLESGVSVIPSYLAKGIEFDAVLIWNASRYGEEDRKLLYTAVTRAMHELVVLYDQDRAGLLAPVLG